ncbi:MAG: InlB B-repeat-containing protein [Clostridia bacterium]|nr:InlB B-repeat-containing protein [Clostridia bacterium]
MKRARITFIILLAAMLLCSIFVFSSCGGTGGTTERQLKKLPTPTVTLDGDTARWKAEIYADRFEISLDGVLYYVENSLTSRKLEDGQTLKIRCIGDLIGYSNSDWSNAVTYVRPIPNYTITWKNGDTVLKEDSVVEGTLPVYEGETPVKLPDAQYSYVFAGWTPEVVEANGDVTYNAMFAPILNKYTVTWKNGDEILETDEGVDYGTMPTYDGKTPQKPSDPQWIYIFSGWSPEVDVVTGNMTYVAQYTPAPNKFTIVWKNGDEILETDENVLYGTSPSYDGETPTKESTAQYHYTFSGWAPEIDMVKESVTYEAQFTATERSYTVTFYSEDGLSVLDRVTVKYGGEAVYSKATPVKNATAGHTYLFEKWASQKGGDEAASLSFITGETEAYATFKSFVRFVTVYIVSSNIDYGTVSKSVLNNIPYGASITSQGNVISINGQEVVAQQSESSAQYTYGFESWIHESTVGNDTVIFASFSREINRYSITWKNGDDVLEVDENVRYGVTPIYNGQTPTKAADNENVYTFSGWSPVISSVSGDTTYVAQFTNTANKHTVIFYDDDGTTELGRVVVSHGESATYPNSLPTKDATDQSTYTFEKWVSEIGSDTEAVFESVTEDGVAYAKYTQSTRTYTVTFCDYDGTELSKQEVEYGMAAVRPGDPDRSGFRFVDWDKDFSSIFADLTVTAKYVQQFTVTFVDYDGSIIDLELVDYNGNARAPEAPTRAGYRFVGWNTTFTEVVSDLEVKAEYIKQYKVSFYDAYGNLIKEEMVDTGTGATAPVAPELEGYSFDSWNKDFSSVTEDIVVKAVYKINTYKVQFLLPDGTPLVRYFCKSCNKYHDKAELIGGLCPICYGNITKETEQIVEHGFSAIAPQKPAVFATESANTLEVYGFTGWQERFNSITEDTVIHAIYDSVFEGPVIVVEFDEENNNSANLYIYNYAQTSMNAIELTINYETRVGKISVDSVEFNSASPFWVADSNGNNNNQYVINNNESTFTFAWSDANGKQYNWCSKVLTFEFSTDGTSVGSESFVVESSNAIISVTDEHGNVTLQKVTPVVVYR